MAAAGGIVSASYIREEVVRFCGREIQDRGRFCNVVRIPGSSLRAGGLRNSRFQHFLIKCRPSRKLRHRCVASAVLAPEVLQIAKDVAVVVMKKAQEMVLTHKIWATILGTTVSVTIAVASSRAIGLGLEADITVAVARSAVQLFALSLALRYMFHGDQMVRAALFIIVMVLAAGHTVGERASKLPQSHLVGVLSLVLGSLLPSLLMVALQVFPRSPAFIVPATAHVLGASVIMVGMTLEALHHEVFSRERQIEAALALGATPQQAIKGAVRRALNLGMAPQIDALKTMGLG